jgi:hypothetical protein
VTTCFLILLLAAGDRIDRQDVGPLTITIDNGPAATGLSVPIEFGVTIVSPIDVVIENATLSVIEDQGALIQLRESGPDRLQGQFGTFDARHWSARIEPLRLGTIRPGKFTVRYRRGEEPPGEWETSFASVEVREDMEGETDLSLRPIPPLPSESTTSIARMLRVAAGFLALVTLLAIVFRGRRSSSLGRPVDWLRDVERSSLLENRQYEAFLLELRSSVRRYLGERYQLASPMRAAEQLLTDPLLNSKLSESQKATLASFLHESDISTFAPLVPDRRTCERALASARAFLTSEPDA